MGSDLMLSGKPRPFLPGTRGWRRGHLQDRPWLRGASLLTQPCPSSLSPRPSPVFILLFLLAVLCLPPSFSGSDKVISRQASLSQDSRFVLRASPSARGISLPCRGGIHRIGRLEGKSLLLPFPSPLLLSSFSVTPSPSSCPNVAIVEVVSNAT